MPAPSHCIRCNAPFACGAQDAQCWCQTLPALDLATLPLHFAGGCFCPACLQQLIDQQHAQPKPLAHPASKPA